MNSARPPIWVVLKAHLAASPRKTGVLVLLFVIMVVVYARWLLKDTGPDQAAAAAALIPPASTAGASAQPAVAPAPSRVRPSRPLVRDLTRDPFAVRPERFAADPEALAAQANAAASLPESRPASPYADFLLQSTITGPMPMAWINGRCVRPGEEIDGYRLERVEPGRIVLIGEGGERVLTME